MKRNILCTLLAVLTLTVSASIKDVRIYINPGHGSWGSEDRAMSTVKHGAINYNDTTNFYESNTNLQKGLALFHKLKEYGMSHNAATARDLTQNLVMSHIKCGVSRGLTEIAAEAELNNFDMFISIHSNAASEAALVNYLLFLYRGTNAAEGNAGSRAMAQACWPHIIENPHQMWTHHNGAGVTNICGDVSYMGSSYTTTHSNGKSYTGYYGVLRQGVPGFLVEGYFHTYQPARHKYMNWNVCHMEGYGYARGINDYFGWGVKETTGYIYGILRDAEQTFSHAYYTPIASTLDNYLPINNATVTLKDANGNIVATTTTDDEYNGAFVFKNINPGTYSITYSHPDYKDFTESVTVKANAVTYPTPQISQSTELIAVQGHFAYDLKSTLSDEGVYTLSFKSTGNVDNGKIIITNKTTGATETITIGAIVKGDNSTTISASQLGADATFSWAVALDNPKSTATSLIHTYSGAAYSNGTYYANGGVAIDLDYESPNYGTIYTSTGYAQGIQAINPDLSLKGSKILGSNFMSNNNSSPFRIATSNGKLYISDWSDEHGGVWVYNPSAATPSVANVFKGTYGSGGVITNGSTVTGGGTTGVTFSGEGSNRKMYVFCEDYPSSGGNIMLQYNLGTADTWGSAPSASFSQIAGSTLMANTNVEVLAHSYGVFCAQTRYSGSNTSGVPSFVHVTADGTVNFNSGTTLQTHDGSNFGAMAIYESTMAVADGNGKAIIYNLSYSGTTPVLSKQYEIALPSTTNVCQMAFDPAGNLYVHSKQQGLLVYAIKNPARSTITKAASAYSLKGVVEPAVQGHYAYGLSLETSPTTHTLTFQSTGDVDNAKLILIDSSTGQETSIDLGAVVKGSNTTTIERNQLPEGTSFKWAIDLDNPQSPSSELIHSDASILYSGGTACLGLTIDLDTESPRFGTIYTATGYGQGIQKFNPDLTTDGEKVLTSSFATGAYSCRLHANDGKVYIADVSSATPGIWLYDPNASTPTATQVVAQQARGIAFTGTGDSRKMYISAYNLDGATDTRLIAYNIGNATSITGTYSNYFDAATSLMPNGKGDLITTPNAIFMAQTRYKGNNSSAVPVFIVLDLNGNITFNSSAINTTLTGSYGGGIALNHDNSLFAIVDSYAEGSPASINLHLYQVKWTNATPAFTHLYSMPLEGTNQVDQMAFDPAGNLYIASSQKGLLVYALKSDARTTRTAAPSAQLLSYSSTTAIEQIQVQSTQTSTYYNLQGIKVDNDKLLPGIYIKQTNGKSSITVIKGN